MPSPGPKSLANLERRTAPFAPGNKAALKHGGRSVLALQPRAEEIAVELAGLLPVSSAADEPAVRLLSVILARLESVEQYVARVGWLDARGRPRPILKMVGRALQGR